MNIKTDKVKKLVELCGGPSAMGDSLGVSRQTIHNWINSGIVPAEYVGGVAALSGKGRMYIRPDIYGVIDGECPKCAAKFKVKY